jgi:hypothetical protein
VQPFLLVEVVLSPMPSDAIAFRNVAREPADVSTA